MCYFPASFRRFFAVLAVDCGVFAGGSALTCFGEYSLAACAVVCGPLLPFCCFLCHFVFCFRLLCFCVFSCSFLTGVCVWPTCCKSSFVVFWLVSAPLDSRDLFVPSCFLIVVRYS